MNNPLTHLADAVSRALAGVQDPVSGKGILSAGRVLGLQVRQDGRVSFTLEAPPGEAERYGAVRDAAEAAARGVRGVKAVVAVLTSETAPAPGVTRVRKGDGPPTAPPGPPKPAQGPPGVKAIVAVASAKGGVGKSTVAANLACAFAALGQRVGLLDADVYGPSLPTMLGVSAASPEIGPDKRLIPVNAHGLKTMSIGYLVDPDAPMIWRGAMATGALRQMLDDVDWGTLDILLIDMPPGTGDVQLTLAQRVPLAGVVIVSTPQEVALADVRRGIAMFERTHVPVLGVIENMAWFELPDGSRSAIFGEGGARKTAEKFGVPFLGEIPIDVSLRQSGDEGKPLVAAQPESAVAQRFRDIAQATLARLAEGAKPAPNIQFV